MRGDQLVRQWKMLQMIENRPGVTISYLAQKLGVSTRTVYRDLLALDEAGFPLLSQKRDGRQVGWRLIDGYHVPQIQLSQAELMALYLSRHLLGVLRESVLGEFLNSALTKVKATLSDRTLSYRDRLQEVLSIKDGPLGDPLRAGDNLYLLQEAMVNRNSVECDYLSLSRNVITRRRIDPYRLHYARGTFYLIGYCHQRKEVRLFHLERMSNLQVLGSPFELPLDFSVETYLGDSLGVFRGERQKVKIRFSPQMARWVKAKTWHPSQKLTEGGDGSLILELTVAGLEEVRNWVLSFGASAEVLEPEELRLQLKAEVEEMKKLYEGT